MQTRHSLDIHLAHHVTTLINLIKNRALVLYFQPFASIKMERMSAAFGWTVEQLEEQVVALERSLLEDSTRADGAAVAALLHPQWSEVGRSGRLWTRAEVLDEIGPLETPVTLDVVTCQRVSEDVLLLLWRAVDDEGSTLRSSLWVRSSGHWRQLFHQGTRES